MSSYAALLFSFLRTVKFNFQLTYVLTYLLTYLLTYFLHGAGYYLKS